MAVSPGSSAGARLHAADQVGRGPLPVVRHAEPRQISGMRHSSSALQGHGVDEPEAVQEALRRSLGLIPMQSMVAPPDPAVDASTVDAVAASTGRMNLSGRTSQQSPTAAPPPCPVPVQAAPTGTASTERNWQREVQPRQVDEASDMDMAAASVVRAATEAPAASVNGGEDGGEQAPARLRRVSAGARALREEFAAEPPPPPPPALVAFPGGIITCTICQQTFANGATGFMRHLTTMHAGVAVDAELLALLRGLQRAACSNSACGGFRRIGMTQCNLCRMSTSARPIQEGHIVPGPRTADSLQAAREAAARDTNMADSATGAPAVGDVELPPNFSDGVMEFACCQGPHLSCTLQLLCECGSLGSGQSARKV